MSALHDLACTNDPCRCKVLWPVREAYNDGNVGADRDSGYAAESHTLTQARPVSLSRDRSGHLRLSGIDE